MNSSTKVVILTLVTLVLIFFTCRFAISDFLYRDWEVIKSKPWRPMARLLFGAVMVPIIMIFARWLRASFSRTSNEG